ncbi:MAG: tetratricopeptide repeat protein [bacterium]
MLRKDEQRKAFFNIRCEILVCVFLVIATLAIYWQVRNHEFINYDDPKYITNNKYVQRGLTSESIIWAFTATDAANWHPLTWLSHMLDYTLYGINPGRHHLSNVLFHIVNSLLLFLLFWKMTKDLWQSSFVAALFALHPLNVESVAWVAERKNVLSTFFWILVILIYLFYIKNPKFNRYLLSIVFFILGLMAKPMLVTLPFVLLLLDYWPLDRFQYRHSIDDNNLPQRLPIFHLVYEKIPFFVLAAAASIVTFLIQKKGGAVGSLDLYPLSSRIANALVSYIKYMVKMICPHDLAIIYPYSSILPWWQVIGACLLLISISSLMIIAMKRHPYLAVGWLWYIGTLVPVIGLVQVGNQAMADRYSYVPLIGLFIIIAWGIPELLPKWRHRKKAFAAIAGVFLSILMAITCVQVRYWANSITLFEHTIDVTVNNYKAYNNLGEAFVHLGNYEKGIIYYSEAVRINPNYYGAYNNLGVAYAHLGNYKKAISHYSEAIRINPNYAVAHCNMGVTLTRQGNLKEAIAHYFNALRIYPNYALAHNNLGSALEKQGKIVEAIKHYSESLRLNPEHALSHYNLGNALASLGRFKLAIVHLQEALRIKPDYIKALNKLRSLTMLLNENSNSIEYLNLKN